jgi:hypothetical protein
MRPHPASSARQAMVILSILTAVAGCKAGDPGAGASGDGSGGAGSGGAGAGGTGGQVATGTGGAGNRGGAIGSGGQPGTGGAFGGRGGATAARPCSAPGLLFCDDFEAADTGTPPPAPRWSTSFNGAATITVDGNTPARSGSRSVHVSTMGSYQAFLVLAGAPAFPAPLDGPLYLRVFMRLGAPMTVGHNTYFKAGAAATLSSDHETRVGVMNGMLMINQPEGDRAFLSNQNYYTDGNMPGVVFAPMTWVCVEALLDPPHSTIDIWVDRNEVPDLHRTDWQQDPLGAFRFGFEKYAGPDADIWYDDVAVGTIPIGCD